MLSYLSIFLCVVDSFLLFLRALGETVFEIPISSAKNRKKIENQKKRKRHVAVCISFHFALRPFVFFRFIVLKHIDFFFGQTSSLSGRRRGRANVKSMRATAGHQIRRPNAGLGIGSKNNHVCGPYFSTFSRLLQIYCAKTYRFLLLANVKSMRATAGHRIRRSNAGLGIGSKKKPTRPRCCIFPFLFASLVLIFFSSSSTRRDRSRNTHI